MNDNDTSDSACNHWLYEQRFDDADSWWFWEDRLEATWQEAVRRCEARSAEAWQKGFETANDTLRKLFEKELEKERRKAFEAGYMATVKYPHVMFPGELDAAYRAYREKEGA